MMLVDSTNKKLEKVIHISYLVLILHIIICLVVFSKLENDFIILGIWCQQLPILPEQDTRKQAKIFFYDFSKF